MKVNTLIVCARGLEWVRVDRHLENWRKFFSEIIIFSPEDDPLPGTEVIGKSGHHGPDAYARCINAFRRGSQYPAVCLAESDCLFFHHVAAETGILICGEVHPNGDPNFKGAEFVHPPFWATSDLCAAIADALPSFYEGGWGDRELGVICPFLGVHLKGVGYSRNSIDTQEYLQQAVEAIQHGAACIHGVKTREVMETLLSAECKVSIDI